MRELIFVMVLLFFLLTIFSLSFFTMGHGLDFNKDYERTWTTAICKGNQCMDFEVTCLGSQVLETKPVSGMVVFSDTWKDKREDNILC
jgi:hypothetical protein